MSRYDVCYKHRFEAPFATFFHSVKNEDSEFQACKKIDRFDSKIIGFFLRGVDNHSLGHAKTCNNGYINHLALHFCEGNLNLQ